MVVAMVPSSPVADGASGDGDDGGGGVPERRGGGGGEGSVSPTGDTKTMSLLDVDPPDSARPDSGRSTTSERSLASQQTLSPSYADDQATGNGSFGGRTGVMNVADKVKLFVEEREQAKKVGGWVGGWVGE